ncbi:MAG: hypothetical protein IJP27_00335 [Clostridia bacterium]|nr:hypothetical protein [Clostridia bacterium]
MKLKEFNDRLKQEITDEMLEMLALEENGAVLHYSLKDERLTDRVVQDIKEGPPDQNKWSFPEIPF